MTIVVSMRAESSRKSLLSFFFLSSILPLLILTFMTYHYLIPLLTPGQIDRLIDVFTFCFAATLSISVLSFFLMSRRIDSLETLANEIKEKSPSILDTNMESVNENEIEILRNAFNSLSNELIEKVGMLKQYADDVIVYNRKLSSLAIIDALTSLYNRRTFERTLVEERNRAERFKHGLSLIMIDINQFKFYNDTYGHQTGDKILQKLGELFRESIRKTDIPFRYGGDEFAILLPETSKERAEEISSKLMTVVSNHQFVGVGKTPIGEVTICCGVSSYCQDQEIESFVKEADIALYKNRSIMISTDEPS
jgi:diguanylate cyclase (GGDEF)-like protein